jgi:hypothetical protein
MKLKIDKTFIKVQRTKTRNKRNKNWNWNTNNKNNQVVILRERKKKGKKTYRWKTKPSYLKCTTTPIKKNVTMLQTTWHNDIFGL